MLPSQLQTALKEYSKKTDLICGSFTDPSNVAPNPGTVYHYTDDRGLNGILSTGQLWLTDLFDLNDPSELLHGIGHSLTLFESEADKGPPEVGRFYRHLHNVMKRDVRSIAHHFVCCFSTTSDDLGQWRAYADDGRGYAIGFDAEALEVAFKRTELGCHSSFPMIYNDEKLRDMHQQLVDATVPVISEPIGTNLDKDTIDTFMRLLSIELASSLIEISIQFKHEAYNSEQEYRFLETCGTSTPIPNLQLRSRPYSLVRYREFDWKSWSPAALREVVIGPASDRVHAFKFVHDCLREYLPSVGPTIKISEIPYRGRLR